MQLVGYGCKDCCVTLKKEMLEQGAEKRKKIRRSSRNDKLRISLIPSLHHSLRVITLGTYMWM
jgi:hypothetical protein